jgi:hypothetical protein
MAGRYESLGRVTDTPARYAVVAYCSVGANLPDHPRLLQRIEEFAVEQFDLPVQTWSRMNVRLDRNQGGQGHAQETIYARKDHSTSANGRA